MISGSSISRPLDGPKLLLRKMQLDPVLEGFILHALWAMNSLLLPAAMANTDVLMTFTPSISQTWLKLEV